MGIRAKSKQRQDSSSMTTQNAVHSTCWNQEGRVDSDSGALGKLKRFEKREGGETAATSRCGQFNKAAFAQKPQLLVDVVNSIKLHLHRNRSY